MPQNKQYMVFDTIETKDNTPTCEGYQFKGWKIVTEGVIRSGGDHFIMPENDVILRAEWSKISIVKSTTGKIYEAPLPVLQKLVHGTVRSYGNIKAQLQK